MYRVFVRKLEAKRPLEDPGLDVRIILKLTFRKWDWDMDWFVLAQDRNRWWALVNAVMKHRVPKIAENLLISCKTI